MVYRETTIQEIKFDKEDIVNWAKTFAARQMGVDVTNLKDEDIKVPPYDISITIKCTKESSNQKEEQNT